MLIGQDVESHTIPYVLTRPLPRSAWIIGRFLAYMMIACGIMGVSLALLFGACTTLQDFGLQRENLTLFAHFWMATCFGMLGYGALTMFLGAFSKRQMVLGRRLHILAQKDRALKGLRNIRASQTEPRFGHVHETDD